MNERSGGVEQFLLIEQDTGDVDGLEPDFDLVLCPIAPADVSSVSRSTRCWSLVSEEGLLPTVHLDGELAGDEAADAGDALAGRRGPQAVETIDVEIDQPERVSP